MSTIALTFRHNVKLAGVWTPTDVTSIVASDPTATYGVKRDDTDAVVVAAGSALTWVSTGVYSLSFAAPEDGLTYTWWPEWVYLGNTSRLERTYTDPIESGYFEVQDPDEPTETANAYVTVAEFKSYCNGRGIDYSSKLDVEIEQAIVRATDYTDGRWIYEGLKYDDDQSTEVPRSEVFNKAGYSIDDIPAVFKLGVCEYTQIDLIQGLTLMPNSQDNTQAGALSYERRKADVVETERHWSTNKGFQQAKWPLADKYIHRSGLLGQQGRRTLQRG